MPDGLSVVTTIVVAALCLLGRRLWSDRRRSHLDWLPPELLDAKLVWSEKAFRSEGPVPIAARIDRVYRSPREGLVLIEFKHREKRRAYLSDVVELSAQRYVMRQAGHIVSRRGYVVVIFPDRTRSVALSVDLEDEQQVERRAFRLVAQREGRATPGVAAHRALCDSCGHRIACRNGPHQP